MYTSNQGLPKLRDELANYLGANYKLNYNPETEILITVGVSEASRPVLEGNIKSGRRSHTS